MIPIMQDVQRNLKNLQCERAAQNSTLRHKMRNLTIKRDKYLLLLLMLTELKLYRLILLVLGSHLKTFTSRNHKASRISPHSVKVMTYMRPQVVLKSQISAPRRRNLWSQRQRQKASTYRRTFNRSLLVILQTARRQQRTHFKNSRTRSYYRFRNKQTLSAEDDLLKLARISVRRTIKRKQPSKEPTRNGFNERHSRRHPVRYSRHHELKAPGQRLNHRQDSQAQGLKLLTQLQDKSLEGS